MNAIDELANRIREHEQSDWDGQDSPGAVILSILEGELAQLDSVADTEIEAAEKRAELRADLGLSDETATDDGESGQIDASDKQEQLRNRILE